MMHHDWVLSLGCLLPMPSSLLLSVCLSVSSCLSVCLPGSASASDQSVGGPAQCPVGAAGALGHRRAPAEPAEGPGRAGDGEEGRREAGRPSGEGQERPEEHLRQGAGTQYNPLHLRTSVQVPSLTPLSSVPLEMLCITILSNMAALSKCVGLIQNTGTQIDYANPLFTVFPPV